MLVIGNSLTCSRQDEKENARARAMTKFTAVSPTPLYLPSNHANTDENLPIQSQARNVPRKKYILVAPDEDRTSVNSSGVASQGHDRDVGSSPGEATQTSSPGQEVETCYISRAELRRIIAIQAAYIKGSVPHKSAPDQTISKYGSGEESEPAMPVSATWSDALQAMQTSCRSSERTGHASNLPGQRESSIADSSADESAPSQR